MNPEEIKLKGSGGRREDSLEGRDRHNRDGINDFVASLKSVSMTRDRSPSAEPAQSRCLDYYDAPGNLGGNAQRTRHMVNNAFLRALAEHFEREGPKVIAKVAKEQPAAYMKIRALLVPREMKVKHSSAVKDLTDEQPEQAIARLRRVFRAGHQS